MNKEFIPYEQALELKELGFDEECLKYWVLVSNRYELFRDKLTNDDVPAPLYQQAFRWFREKHGLFGCIDLQVCNPSHWFIRIDKIEINDYLYHSEDENIQYSTYEEAELACLIKLTKIVLQIKGGEVFAKNSDIKIEIVKNK
jgi:hypothetical protein